MAFLQELFAKVNEAASAAFAPDGREQSAKRKSKGTAKGANDQEMVEVEPLPPKQAAWLAQCVQESNQATLSIFGSAIEGRIKAGEKQLNDRIDTTDKRADGIQNELTNVKNEIKNTNAHFTKKVEELVKENTALKEKVTQNVAAPGGAASNAASSNRPSLPPVGERTLGCLGNLGWDSPAQTLLERAENLMKEMNLEKPRDYKSITCPSKMWEAGSSFCHVDFVSPTQIATVGRKIDELKKSLIPDKPDKYVFLTVHKSREERAPTRMIRACAAKMNFYEQQRDDTKKTMTAKPQERSVNDGMDVYAYIDQFNVLRFTHIAKQRYPTEQLDIIFATSR